MSNTASINVRNITNRHNPNGGHSDIFIEDAYANESLYCEEIPNTAKELFLYVKNWGGENAQGIIDFVLENDKDMLIEGEWYEAKQLEEWLKE